MTNEQKQQLLGHLELAKVNLRQAGDLLWDLSVHGKSGLDSTDLLNTVEWCDNFIDNVVKHPTDAL